MANNITNINWVTLLAGTGNLSLKTLTKVYPSKGRLVYEYNPLRNYRLSYNMYLYKNSLYSLYELYTRFNIHLGTSKNTERFIFKKTINKSVFYTFGTGTTLEGYEKVEDKKLVDELELCENGNGNKESLEKAIIECRYNSWVNVPATETDPVLYEKGQLSDFITNELSFSLSNPVTITPQYSYDGTVNLILNDGLNIPRLINTRFSATGKNTYEIVDRRGDNDTNIYDQGAQFDIDTSLYKRTTKIPKLSFMGVNFGGSLKVGNYFFYFKFSDADGNETDFIAESGLVSVFIGQSLPSVIHTGMSDQNSNKAVSFLLTNIDPSYNYVTVYYSRTSAQKEQNCLPVCTKIDKRYTVSSAQSCSILITGFEDNQVIPVSEINMQYNVAQAAKTAVATHNMLFMGNICKPTIPYQELEDLSLHFLPYVKEVNYPMEITENYVLQTTHKGYYDPSFIYSSVGYWNDEYYRFGIVYILPNNELSPVFNIRGRYGVKTFGNISSNNTNFPISEYNDGQYNDYKVYIKDQYTEEKKRSYINIEDQTYYVIDPTDEVGTIAIERNYWENSKGVVTLDPTHDTNQIFALDVRVSSEVIEELKKYVKGYFFVRQKRIPTILAQGITIGIDKNARTPTIPTAGGILEELAESLDGSTYVEVKDINDVNFVSEGFLSRYAFKLKKKKSGFWKVFKKIMVATTIAAALAVGTIVTMGAGSIAAGVVATAVLPTVLSAGTVATSLAVVGIATAAVTAAGFLIGGTIEGVRAIQRSTQSKELKGRNTNIPTGMERSEESSSRILTHEFEDRLIIKNPSDNEIGALLCPDFDVDQPFYNEIFNGGEFVLQSTISQCSNGFVQGYTSNFFTNDKNHFYVPSYIDRSYKNSYTANIQTVPDNTALLFIEDKKYRSRAGWPEEAWRFEQVGKEYEDSDKQINSDIIRGAFGPYLAMSGFPFLPCETVTVKVPGYSETNTSKYVEIRISDNSPYYAISDREAISDIEEHSINKTITTSLSEKESSVGYSWELYRGDCYICQFTHRLNRNFNDPSAPYNDLIVDEKTWKDNYDLKDTVKYGNINLGDVNAVKMGMWVTFRVRSSKNLNIRSLDGSVIDEVLMSGHERGFFPYHAMSTEGPYKTPDSDVYNKGFKTNLSEKLSVQLADVPYIKNWFGTRIMYSDIHVNDAFKNGFRVFQGTNYIDCPRTYGEITKLVEIGGNILVVFEHGIGLIGVNEAASQQQAASNFNHLTVANVLSQPVMLSDTYGSQWQDSILKSPSTFGDGIAYVYGVDTVAKKIWRTNGQGVECISDMKVQEFLNNYITLGERELTPIIGIRNVKTVYNSFKRDVMFTFYDNLQGFEENVWNLCWNELVNSFTTFYSWVPSYMENINNLPFSFNRNTSKWIAKLGISHADNSFSNGIVMSNNIMENSWTGNEEGTDALSFKSSIVKKEGVSLSEGKITYKNKSQKTVTLKAVSADNDQYTEEAFSKSFISSDKFWYLNNENSTIGLIGILGLTGVNLPDSTDFVYSIEYSLQRDNFLNYEYFDIKEVGYYYNDNQRIPVYGLYLKSSYSVMDLVSELYYRNNEGHSYADFDTSKTSYKEKGIGTIVTGKYPIFKNRAGKRLTLDRADMLNPTHIVRLLNIRAIIKAYYSEMSQSVEEYYYNYADNSNSQVKSKGQWINCGYYESSIAIIPRWNIQFLSTDFWKHGQGGLIDIADKIYPAYWYGEQHPFEFEFVVQNDPLVHKIFTNLEIVSNNTQPESFHYEIVGDTYDFAKDKVNMYYRQEAMKAIYQYNGADILYNRNFLETQPVQQKVSADLPHTYYARQDTFNDIYDSYKSRSSDGKNYDHLSGSEIVYYPTTQEYKIWTHQKAVSLDDFGGDSTAKRISENGEYVYDEDGWETARSIINSNCKYQEDRWRVSISPIVICFKNEYRKDENGNVIISPDNSTWTNPNRPKLPVYNSPLPPDKDGNNPFEELGNNDLPSELTSIGYTIDDFDDENWLENVDIHSYNWEGESNREEVELRDKFIKIRIRYSGDKLALINFVNTIYQISMS